MILVRGTRDMFVDRSNLDDLASAGSDAGLPIITTVVPGDFHEDLLSDLARPDGAVREAVDAFIEAVIAR